MAETKKSKLAIHHSNLFYPKPSGITQVALCSDHVKVVLIRETANPENKCESIRLIELYDLTPNSGSRLMWTEVVVETITAVTWINWDTFLTTSREQTINLYSIKNEQIVQTLITDYGPISCLRYSIVHKLLITGTDFGYVVAYRLDKKWKNLEYVDRMVKINGKIRSVDMCFQPRRSLPPKKSKAPTKNTTKRKRRGSSGEEDSDGQEQDDTVEKNDGFLDQFDLTIYGASDGDIIAWDYHKKTIVETMRVGESPCVVNCLLVLKSRDIVAGDSTGAISIFDKNTYTCKLFSKVLESGVLCMVERSNKDHESRILISGEDPTVVKMKNARSSTYYLSEKYVYHTHPVTSLIYTAPNCFLSASIDGQFVLHRSLRNKENGKTVTKIVTHPCFKDKIKFSDRQMMIQESGALKIWSLPMTTIDSPRKGSDGSESHNPTKLLLIKSKSYIHCSVFSSRWIVYSTDRGLYIFDRAGDKLKTFRTSTKIPACKSLELCTNGRYLFAALRVSLYIIDLHSDTIEESQPEESSGGEKRQVKQAKLVVKEEKLRACIQQMLYFDHTDQLIVSCTRPKNYLYSIGIDKENSLKFKVASLRYESVTRFMTYNAANKRDRNVYLYTSEDKIVRVDLSQDDFGSTVATAASDGKKPEGLPENTNILGMIMISRDQCIMFDDSHLFKVDLTSNKVVNQNSDYGHIVNIDNFLYKKPDHVALAELRHEDYLRLLPPISVKLKSKFGDA